ncbi:MAG: restriction endonuclease subunit S [Flammeovirgaceae bacterium]
MEAVTTQLSFDKYEAYKDSGVEWLGEIPEHWDSKKLKYLLKFTTGGTPSSESSIFYSGNEPWITISNMNGKYINETNFISKAGVKNANIPLTVANSLLFSFKLSVGQVAFTQKDIYTNEAIASFYPQKETNLKFWYYALPLFVPKNANTNIYGALLLNQNLINNATLLIPPTQEQTAIANFLDKKCGQIDQAIAQKERMIELLKERKQIIIQQAVTKGLNPNAPMKDSGIDWIGEIPEHWRIKKLKYVAEVQTGLTLGKSYHQSKLVEVPYLRVANVQGGYCVLDNITSVKIPKEDVGKYLLQKGDVLVTEGGDLDKLGRGTIWNNEIEPCIHQNHLFAIRVNEEKVNAEYLTLSLNANYGRKYFIKTGKKTTNLASTNGTKLMNFPLIAPSIAEQQIILDYINQIKCKINNTIDSQQSQIHKLKEYKSTLINSAVTGKIKVG